MLPASRDEITDLLLDGETPKNATQGDLARCVVKTSDFTNEQERERMKIIMTIPLPHLISFIMVEYCNRLDALLKLVHFISSKSLSNFYSVFTNESSDKIYIEIGDIGMDEVVSILNTRLDLSIGIDDLEECSNADIIEIMCNEPMFYRIRPGQLIRLNINQYKYQVARVIDINRDTNLLTVKTVPFINYELLKSMDNPSMEQIFRSNPDIKPEYSLFEPDILPHISDKIVLRDGRQMCVDKWDGNMYNEGFIILTVKIEYIFTTGTLYTELEKEYFRAFPRKEIIKQLITKEKNINIDEEPQTLEQKNEDILMAPPSPDITNLPPDYFDFQSGEMVRTNRRSKRRGLYFDVIRPMENNYVLVKNSGVPLIMKLGTKKLDTNDRAHYINLIDKNIQEPEIMQYGEVQFDSTEHESRETQENIPPPKIYDSSFHPRMGDIIDDSFGHRAVMLAKVHGRNAIELINVENDIIRAPLQNSMKVYQSDTAFDRRGDRIAPRDKVKTFSDECPRNEEFRVRAIVSGKNGDYARVLINGKNNFIRWVDSNTLFRTSPPPSDSIVGMSVTIISTSCGLPFPIVYSDQDGTLAYEDRGAIRFLNWADYGITWSLEPGAIPKNYSSEPSQKYGYGGYTSSRQQPYQQSSYYGQQPHGPAQQQQGYQYGPRPTYQQSAAPAPQQQPQRQSYGQQNQPPRQQAQQPKVPLWATMTAKSDIKDTKKTVAYEDLKSYGGGPPIPKKCVDCVVHVPSLKSDAVISNISEDGIVSCQLINKDKMQFITNKLQMSEILILPVEEGDQVIDVRDSEQYMVVKIIVDPKTKVKSARVAKLDKSKKILPKPIKISDLFKKYVWDEDEF